jgi:hypothetical protein
VLRIPGEIAGERGEDPGQDAAMGIDYEWRGSFTNVEANALHAEAFETRTYDESEWNWVELTARHSLGWVVARRDGHFVGFVNVLWDGLVHADACGFRPTNAGLISL